MKKKQKIKTIKVIAPHDQEATAMENAIVLHSLIQILEKNKIIKVKDLDKQIKQHLKQAKKFFKEHPEIAEQIAEQQVEKEISEILDKDPSYIG